VAILSRSNAFTSLVGEEETVMTLTTSQAPTDVVPGDDFTRQRPIPENLVPDHMPSAARALEASGTVTGYRAQLHPQALGLGFESLVVVTTRGSDNPTLVAFEQAVVDVSDMPQTQRLFGEPDYLLRLMAGDLPGVHRLSDETLTGLPEVRCLTPTLIMRTFVAARRSPARATRTACANRDTAAELLISDRTLQFHITNIYWKWGCGTHSTRVPLSSM
jgi:DNA-binding Lrp family transcriptional regulator